LLDNKKKTITYAIIGVCFVAAGVSYYVLSDSSPKQTPQLKATEAKSDAIQAGMAAEQAKQPQPPPSPPPPPGITRGSVQRPK
jgi:hypothetical protein